MNYYRFEPGQPVTRPALLIHGFASNPLELWEQTGWLKVLLQAGIPCLVLELPHHGSADFKEGFAGRLGRVEPAGQLSLKGKFSYAAVTEALAGLCQTLGQQLHLVGYSLGSFIAHDFAGSYSQQLLSLTLAGMPTQDQLPQLREHFSCAGPSLPARGSELYPLFEQIIASSLIKRQSLARFINQLPEYSLVGKALPSCPTLLIRGSRDQIATAPRSLAADLAAAGRQYRQVEVKGRDHVNVLTSAYFKKTVRDWILGWEQADCRK